MQFGQAAHRWQRRCLLSMVCTTVGLFAIARASFAAQTAVPVAVSHVNSSVLPLAAVINQHLVGGVPMTSQPLSDWPAIVTKAAVVMDLDTGTVVYAKQPLAPHDPASITKIMTALLALQDGSMTDILTASPLAVAQPPDKLYLVPGEKVPLNKLLPAMMVDSANDAAVMIAQRYGGSIAGFAAQMNAEAKSIGADHTHFVNPSGLPAPDHITTAYDMALITRVAMQNRQFRALVATRSYDWIGEKWSEQLLNLNQMLFTYPGAIGVKTGYTSQANETLVVAATRQGITFLAVLMDCRLATQIDDDATALLNFAFAHYLTRTILPAGAAAGVLHSKVEQESVPVFTTEPITATVLRGTSLSVAETAHLFAPTVFRPAKTTVGSLEMWQNGTKATDVPVALGSAWVVPSPPAVKLFPVWEYTAAGATVLVSLWTLRRRRNGKRNGRRKQVRSRTSNRWTLPR